MAEISPDETSRLTLLASNAVRLKRLHSHSMQLGNRDPVIIAGDLTDALAQQLMLALANRPAGAAKRLEDVKAGRVGSRLWLAVQRAKLLSLPEYFTSDQLAELGHPAPAGSFHVLVVAAAGKTLTTLPVET
jgi:hypothetical protein